MSSATTNFEPLYVVDTHALIWYLLSDRKLSANAKAIFQAAEQHQTLLVVSVIVLAELYYANVKNHWFPDYDRVFNDLARAPYIRFVALNPEHVLDFAEDMAVPEMPDRLIAGLARRLNAPLVTSDPLITAAATARILW